jgi:hypothetical protein
LGEFSAPCELTLTVPAVTTTELPNNETIKYEFQSADDEAFSVNVQSEGVLITQTGQGSAGAAAATKRFRPASDVRRWLRYRAIKTGTGNVSAKTADVAYHC